MVKFTQNKPQAAGPSSAIGVQRFFDTDQGGPKLTPEMVLGVAVVVCIVFIALQAFNVFG
ncbi:MAG: preprotein translocase subunit Sec61beta [Candidatus Diapherotrites archaeon]